MIKNRPGYAEVTIDEIRKETRINLHANREALERLCNDPWVDVYDDSEGIRFRYRPMHGIRDRESLEHVLQRARADGIRQNDIEKAYEGVQEDIERMVKAGIVIKVQASDQVFKKGQGKSADAVRQPARRGAPAASEEVRDLWAACKVPEGQPQAAAHRRGLRDEDDYGSATPSAEGARKGAGAKQAKAPRRDVPQGDEHAPDGATWWQHRGAAISTILWVVARHLHTQRVLLAQSGRRSTGKRWRAAAGASDEPATHARLDVGEQAVPLAVDEDREALGCRRLGARRRRRLDVAERGGPREIFARITWRSGPLGVPFEFGVVWAQRICSRPDAGECSGSRPKVENESEEKRAPIDIGDAYLPRRARGWVW